MKLPLTQEQKQTIWDEIDGRFDPEFNDYFDLCIWVCEQHGIEFKDIEL